MEAEKMKKASLIGFVVFFVMAGPALGDTPRWLSEVEIAPPNPTSSDVVAITLSGVWGNSCTPNGSAISVMGNDIFFDVIHDYPPGIMCAMVITGWERTESVGPLPPGTYTVYARLVNRDAEPYAPVAEFVVTPSQDSGLFAHWKFDEGEGDIAYDSVGTNDGNVYGAQWTTGQIDGALDFDGEDDYVALPDNDPVWLPQYNFALSVWVCFEREPASVGETILDLNHGDSSDPGNELGCKIGRTVAAGKLAFQMTTTTNTDEDLFSDDVLVKNKWYHIVAVRDGTTQAIYIDGQLSADRTCSPDPIDFVGGYDDDKVNIGRSTTRPGDPRFHLKGKIDDVRIYDRALSAEEIRQLYQEGTGGLVGHWKFDEGEGDIAYDSAGDNDGSVYGAQWTTGKIDGALDFDGEDDYVALPDNDPVWLPQYNFTLSVWVCFEREPASAPQPTILDFNFGESGTTANELGYKVGISPIAEKLVFAMTTTTNPDENLFSDDVLVANKWYHIVAVRDGTTQAIYIDGQLSADRTCSPDPIDFVGGYDDDKVNIGRYTTRPGEPRGHLDGKIDDVRIYDRALSPEEIEQLYHEGTDGLVAHWKFDEGEGDIAYDSVGTNDGNVHGAQWATGKIDGALDFNGLADYVEVTDDPSLRFSQYDSFSISYWAKPLSGLDGSILGKYRAGERSGVFGYRTSWYGDKSAFRFDAEKSYSGKTIIYTPDDSAPAGIWYHVTCVYDNKDMKIYLNGQFAADGTFSYDTGSTTPDNNLTMGARLWDHTIDLYFNGKIDDVRIYNRALSEEEVLQLYQIPPRLYPACWDYLTQCHGDSDNTGDVKGSDFLALRSSWFKCYPDPEYNPCADFDRDGCVDGADFLTLKSNWYKPLPLDCTPGDPYEIYQ